MFLESVPGVGGSILPVWKLGISRYLHAGLWIRNDSDPVFFPETDPVDPDPMQKSKNKTLY